MFKIFKIIQYVVQIFFIALKIMSSTIHTYSMKPEKPADVKKDSLARAQLEVRQRLERWLENTPYKFNPDTSTVETIIKGLALRRLKYGEEYCPCRVVKEDEEENKRIVCPCIYHEEEIAQNGICFCGLFVGPNYQPA